MAVNISKEEMTLLNNSGLSVDAVKGTVDKYRSDGLSDDEIRSKIDFKLQEISKPTETPKNQFTENELKYNTANPSPELKAKIDAIEKQKNDKISKIWTGGAIKIASPLVGLGLAPFTGGMSIPASLAVTGGAEGLTYGLGDTIQNDLKGAEAIKNTALQGLIGAGMGAGQGALFKYAPKILPKSLQKKAVIPKDVQDLGQLATNPQKYVSKALSEQEWAAKNPEKLVQPSEIVPELQGVVQENVPAEKGQSKLTQSLQEGKVANQGLKEELKNVNPEYDVITNKETVKKAQETVLNSNPAELSASLQNIDKPNAYDFTQARELIRRLQDEGNFEAATSLAEKMATKASEAGQAVQALSLWGRLTPEGALRYANRVIANTNKTIKNPAKHIKMTPEQAQELTNLAKNIDNFAEGTRERDIATAQLLKYTGELVPAKFSNKIKTFRNISLLLNPKTLGRNVIGNTGFNAVENISRTVATPLDMAASAFTGQRTRVLPNIGTQLKGYRQGAQEGLQDALLGIDTKGDIGKRFDAPTGRSFRNGILGKLETGLDIGLRVPDRAQYQAVYNESLQNIMKAKGVQKPTNEMVDQATQEALQAVFQDNSNISKVATGVRDAFNMLNIKGFGLGDAIMPYAQTPANLANQSINYSPVGLLKAIASGLEGNQRQATMDAARALVGSGIIGAGYLGAKSGNITGNIGENQDFEMRANEALRGNKPQTMYFGNTGVSYALFQPMSTNISVGSALASGDNPYSSGANALLDLPFMQGVQNFTEDFKRSGPIDAALNSAAGVPSQFVPSVLNSLTQSLDNTARETYSPSKIQTGINKAIAKIPIVSKTLPIRYNVQGQPQEIYPNGSNNLFNTFINPANMAKKASNPVVDELSRLYQATGEKAQYLPYANRKIKLNGKDVKLSGKQVSDYQKLLGFANNKYTENLINSNEYQNVDDIEKIKMIQSLQKDIKKGVENKLFGTEPLLSRKQKTKESIIKAKLSKYNRIKNLIQRANISEFLQEY